ncbi:MAG: PEP-CTERM system TPR-repeat protein PrsT [Rhodospirillales bacterium]|nr:PEP-CTERM system TPR-repeat protein PrsT [Rhodospirillales bacterium]
MSRAAFSGAKSIAAASALLILTVGLTACDDAAKTPEDFLTRAEQSREAGDLRASIIDLKNALQADPHNARARRLMGLNYLDMGAWRAAETTLERAQNDGADRVLLLRPLARVKLALGKPDQALKLTELSDDMQSNLKADLLVLRGRALVNQRKREDGRKAFDDALKQNKNSYGAYLGLAGLAVADKKNDEADKLFAKAAAIAPDNSDVLMFQGAYARFKKDHKGAEAAFQKLVTRHPGRFDYRIGLAQAQLATSNHEGAIKTLAPVLKAAPNHPSANYLRALAAYQAKDYQTVTLHTENILKFDRSNLPTILIAGAARFAMKQYERAASDLERFVSQVPTHELARQLLGAAQLHLRKPKEAVSTLKPIAENKNAGAGLLSLIGTAAVQSKDLAAGVGYFERVVKLTPENAPAHAQLGITRIAMGDVDRGIRELTKAVEKDPAFRRADVALITNLLRAKRYAEALEAAHKFQQKLPKDANGYTLAGLAQMGLKDDAGAKNSFEMALEIEPGKPDASNNLASFALQNKQTDKAVGYLRGVLLHHPEHIASLLRLSHLEAKRGNQDQTGELLSRAVSASPNALQPRLLLGRFQLVMGTPKKAIGTIQPALRGYPNNPDLLKLAGEVHLANRAYSEAASIFRHLLKQHSYSAEAHFLLAQAYAGMRDPNSLRKELETTLKVDDKHQRARISLARLLITARQLDDAEIHIADLKKALPKSPVVKVLEGDLLFSRGKAIEASRAYATAMKAGSSTQLIMKLANATWFAGDRLNAISIIEKWVDEQPDTVGTRLQLASYYSALNRKSDAATQYRTVIKLTPNSWLPRNELAWLLFQNGDIDDAYSLAKQARALAPNNPQSMDTMGIILLARGEPSNALGLLAQAAKLAPFNFQFKFHLAQALVKNDRREEAARVLNEILATKRAFAERKEATLLLKSLRK